MSSSGVKRIRDPAPSPKPSITPTIPTSVAFAPRPHIPTPDEPREDLTERLRKEFGLNIEDSEGDGSDSESSGPTSEYAISHNQCNGPSDGRTNGPVERKGWNDRCYWERDSNQRNSQL